MNEITIFEMQLFKLTSKHTSNTNTINIHPGTEHHLCSSIQSPLVKGVEKLSAEECRRLKTVLVIRSYDGSNLMDLLLRTR